ncbi:AEC family transporter [Alcanivorax sp. S6407]|uniref:AEC family transporter n=1 Tax=Alcanivorax sp. S6407 TaxID=2926424 RepID=UPI001FF195E8|nr:AEC family transporter [Alcanivorax sp. S6407]MCK0154122.1 AEC family transporter [Alcanivorax sp. S6407]
MLLTLWNIIVPVLFCAGLGYFWARAGKPFDTQMVTSLVTTVTTPCLIVATLGKTDLDMTALTQVAGVALTVMFLTLALAALAIRISGQPFRIFLPSLAFPNTGNMGIPLCMLAFGDEGLALALAWMMVYSVFHFSMGMAIVSGKGFSLSLFRHPILLSVFLAVAMVGFQLTLPEWLFNTVSLIGDVTIPLMLITLGVSLSQLKVHHVGKGAGFAALRLLIGFAVGLFVVELLDLQGPLRGVALIESTMPVAVFNYLLARAFNHGTEEVAAMVVFSTLMAFLILPFLLTLAL